MARMHGMARWLLFAFWTAAVVSTGCGQKPAPPAAQVEPKTAAANPPPTASSTAKNPASMPAVPPPTVEPKPVASPLRDLAARYLQSDGQGGWRKNEAAATELEKLEETDQLWPLLADPKVEVRRGAAVYLLTQFDPADSNQTAAFSKLLDDSDRTVRSMGLNALRQFQRDDQIAALPQIEKLLDAKHEDRPENRAAATRICGTLKSDAAAALPGLQRAALSDPDAKVRGPALVAIAQIVEPEKAASALSQGLGDTDATVRRVAVARLKQLGAQAAPATTALAAALADSNTDVAE